VIELPVDVAAVEISRPIAEVFKTAMERLSDLDCPR
jgi:hypothetical protein